MPPAQGWKQDHTRRPYLSESLVTRYVYTTGLADVPVAYTQGAVGDPVTAEAVSVTKPQQRKVVEFEYLRQGDQPPVPDFTPLPGEVLLKIELELEDPKTWEGLQYVYRVAGRYTYMLTQPLAEIAKQWPIGPIDAGTRQPVVFDSGNPS